MDALFNRKQDNFLERFRKNPLLAITQMVHKPSSCPIASHIQDPIRLVCISDTHNKHDSIPPLPEGDILIHAGDLTERGSPEELHAVLGWMQNQPHPHKIFIGGNHDKSLSDEEFVTALKETYPELTYLQDSSVTLSVKGRRELKVYGSPKVPRCGNFVFQYEPLAPWNKTSTVWSDIPVDTDILITHCPPCQHLDVGYGCAALLEALWRIKPQLHVFGHIHEARGMERVSWTPSQRAYENIARKTAGWASLSTVALGRVPWRTMPLDKASQTTTLLVNAAIMGGILNDVVNEATVVEI